MRAKFGRGPTVVSNKATHIPQTSIDNPLNPPGVGQFFLVRASLVSYPHTRAKFGRGPTVMSKKARLNL